MAFLPINLFVLFNKTNTSRSKKPTAKLGGSRQKIGEPFFNFYN